MSRFLHRLGRGAALHPWRTLGAWVLAAAIVFGLAGASAAPRTTTGTCPGAGPARHRQLREHVPGAGNASAQVVVHGTDGEQPAGAQLAVPDRRAAAMDHAVAVTPPRISADGDTALLVVSYDVPVTDPDLMGNLEPLEDAVADTRDAGLQVEFGGDLPGTAAAPMKGYGELIGVDRRPAHPAAGLRLRRRRRAAGLGRAGRPRRRLRRAGPAGRRDGRQHRRPDGGEHGRPRRRHRLRPAAGHPPRGVPRARATTSPRRPVAPRPPPDARSSSPRPPCWSP